MSAAPAFAQDADALIKRGVELRREGQDQAALEQFRRAFEIAPTPRALAQMGLAEQALGRWIDAEAHVGKALEAAQDPWIAKYRETLEQSRAKIAEHLGSLAVTGGPAGAELRVDGQPAGALPLPSPLRLPAGTVTLELTAGGRVVATRTVSVAAALGAPEARAAAPAATAREATFATDAASAPSRSSSSSSWSTRRKLEWTAGGSAVALGIVGATFGLVGRNDASSYDANSECRVPKPGQPCQSLHDDGDRDYAIATIALAAAGALAVTAGVLYLTTPNGDATSEARVACLPDLAPDRGGAACTLRF